MKRVIAAAGLALAAVSTAACGGTHTSSPATMTVTTTPPPVTITVPPQPTMPAPPMVQTPSVVRQWVNAGQLDFYVDYAFYTPSENEVMSSMYVKNTSGVPQTYSADAQQLVDNQGRVFAPRSMAVDGISTSDPPGGAIDQFDLNPGMVSGLVYLYVKVPPDMALDQFTLMVHGSHTSIGSPIHFHGTYADP
jgi:hypothetical protein